MSDYRLGIDIGGTKIEIVALDAEGQVVLRHRVGNPGTYKGLLSDVKKLVDDAHARTNPYATVGVGIPGAVDAHTRLVKNANATWLNGQPFADDLQDVLGFPVRVENDANCFALSEATDGAAAGCHVVFGVILGSGMGGGIIVEGKPLKGLHDIAGELGHTPLPWVREDEFPMPKCFCGNSGCLERFLCGRLWLNHGKVLGTVVCRALRMPRHLVMQRPSALWICM